MDFFFRNLEAAQEQARNLTITASQSARGFAEQLSEQTKTFAEQATTVSSAAAEQASQRWKELNLQEALQLRALQSTGTAEIGPSSKELEQYAITPDFKEFIRSLTYSTFRDFPLEQLPQAAGSPEGAKILTPWQEKHALLVVQEVKEINELRFVLCPKRMNDAQFWMVYFTLAKKYLPAEAFDPEYIVTDSKDAKDRMVELQSGLKRTLETARDTAIEWSSRASGTLRPAETSAQLHDLVESRSRGNTPKAQNGAIERSTDSQPFAANQSRAAEPDLDNDLEAYLQTITTDEREHKGHDTADVEGSEEEDLDKYLDELNTTQPEKPADGGEDDAVDLEEYMQQLEQEHGEE